MNMDCCMEKTCLLNHGVIALIRNDFDSKLYEQQNTYLSSLIDVNPNAKRNRITYNIRDTSGLRKVQVCKTAFLKILGIGKKRITVLLKKIQPYSGDVEVDQRRVNRNAKRIPLDLKAEVTYKREKVVEHIHSYDREALHCAREKNPRGRQFLAPNLSIKEIWRQFLTKKGLRDEDAPLSYNSFRKIFRTFNLSFRKPYVDTCGYCDSLSVIIKYNKDEEEKETT
ncbi:hypothetical protein QZH41_018543 [Actinostola sp. cb2023]|nr:hypothetical protein QZH41_018543 [Actinostola sp. cb2023]